MPLRVCTGFEFGPIATLAGLIKGNTGNRLIEAAAGTPTIVSSAPVRTGSYALELNPAGASEYVRWTTAQFGASQTRCVTTFALRFPTLPSASVDLVQLLPAAGTDDLYLFYNQPDSTLRMGFATGGTGSTGPVIAANTWYVVELYWQVNAATHTCDWWVNGVAQSQASKATAASTVSGVLIGTLSADTYTVRVDDVAIWTDTVAIAAPMGSHKVVKLGADNAGTATQIGTANATGRMVSNTTIDATFSSSAILAALTEVPPLLGATATGVGQRTAGATNAVEIPMTTYTLGTGEVISGVRVLVAGWSASATTNNIGLRVFNGTTEEILFATADPNFDALDPCAWLARQVVGATMFDTQTKLNAMGVRLGYSTDISPLPGAHAIYAEVAIKEATQAVAPAAVTATVTAGTLTVAGTSPTQNVTPAAVSVTVTPSSTVKVSHHVTPGTVTVTASAGTLAISGTTPVQNILPTPVSVTATPGTLTSRVNVTPAPVTVTATAGTVRVGQAVTVLTESFNKADGPLGPDLDWRRQITPAQGSDEIEVVGNAAKFAAAGITAEDLWIPEDFLGSVDQIVTLEVTELTKTVTGSYWVAGGTQLRMEPLNAGANYRAYAAEVGVDNQIFPGVDIWHVLIWRIDTTLAPPDHAVVLAGGGTADLAGVVLPGVLHFAVAGEQLAVWFTHSGTAQSLFADVVDTTYTDGRYTGLAGGHVLVPGDTGSITVDNFRAVTGVQLLALDAAAVTVTTSDVGTTGGGSSTQHVIPNNELDEFDAGQDPTPPTDLVDAGDTATPPENVIQSVDATALTVTPGTLTVAAIAAGAITPQPVTVTVTPRTLTVTRGVVHITPTPTTVIATTGAITVTGPVPLQGAAVSVIAGTVFVGAFALEEARGWEIIVNDTFNQVEVIDTSNEVVTTDASNEMFIVDDNNQIGVVDHDQSMTVSR